MTEVSVKVIKKMNTFTMDHMTGDFNRAMKRAIGMLGYGMTREEVCDKLFLEYDDREFAYLAYIGAKTAMELDSLAITSDVL